MRATRRGGPARPLTGDRCRAMQDPFPGVPGAVLHRLAKAPEAGRALVRTGANKRPALPRRQGYDAVDVGRHDLICRTLRPLRDHAAPASVGTDREEFLDIAARQDFRPEGPGMVVRRSGRLGPRETMQGTPVVEMVFHERRRHALDAHDDAAGWRMGAGESGNAPGHPAFMPPAMPIATRMRPDRRPAQSASAGAAIVPLAR